MINIISDNTPVEAILRAIENIITANGAYLHPKISLVCDQGNLSLLSALPAHSKDCLITLPESCLPAIQDFNICAENDHFILQSCAKSVSHAHRRILKLILQLYNETEKLTVHKHVSLWFAFQAQPQLVAQLVKGRAKAPKIQKLYDDYQSGHWQTLLLTSFFGTRTFNLNKNTTARSVLLPFIDVVNHHFYAKNFTAPINTQTHQHELSITNSKMQLGSDETFVCYNSFDTLDIYLVYHFYEPLAPLVRSIPLTISIPDIGILVVQSRIGLSYKRSLPPAIEDLRMLIPPILEYKNNTLSVAHLIIPNANTPNALRRILGFLLRNLDSSLNRNLLFEHILFVEQQILRQNIDYYTETEIMLDVLADNLTVPIETIALVKNVMSTQIKKIKDYMQRFNIKI